MVILEEELKKIVESGRLPRLLLHTCCAPCASYVVEYLAPYFKISCLFFNPNIYPEDEYLKRAREMNRFLREFESVNPVALKVVPYDGAAFEKATMDFQHEPEGGKRCEICFEMRLGETAKRAVEGDFDYFTTTLPVSPHKNAKLLNEIGSRLAAEHSTQGTGPVYLSADFKKKDCYKRSIELSNQYGLYRQSYCGCKTTAIDDVYLSLNLTGD